MKLLKFFAVFLLSIALMSCSNDKEKTTTKAKKDKPNSTVASNTEAPNAEGGKFLKYKFTPGEKISYKLTTKMKSSESLSGEKKIENKLDQTVNYLFDLDVISADDYGNFNVEIFTKAITAEATMNGKPIEYDSKFLYSSRERFAFADYEALKNKSFLVRINETGNILEIGSVEGITNELLTIQGIIDSVSSDQKTMFQQQFIETALKPMCEQLFKITPDKALKVNSGWERKYPSQIMVYKIQNIATFQVRGFVEKGGKEIADIYAHLGVEWDGPKELDQDGAHYSFSEPKVSGSGDIQFNVDDGRIQYSQSRITMDVSVKVTGKDQNNKAVKASKHTSMESVNTLELIL